MQIAVVSEGYFPEVSGVTIAVEQHLRYLTARGHDVMLVHPHYPPEALARMPSGDRPPGEFARFEFESDPIAPYRPESRVPSPAGARSVDAAVERFVSGGGAVVFHNPDRMVPELAKLRRPRRVAGLAGARRAGAAPVAIVHTLMPRFVERSGAWLWRTPPAAAVTRRVWSGIYNDNFDYAVTVDLAAAEYLREVGVRVPLLAGPYNGVDTGAFALRPRRPRPRGPLRLCWIGRLVAEKNAHLLPHLVRALRDAGLDVELAVVGDGPLAPSLRASLAPGDAGAFRGWLPPRDVAAELARADLYVSMSDAESYSLTASEALATGVPVVVPDAIGFRRLAHEGVGLVYPSAWLTPRGMRSLARALVTSLPRLESWEASAARMAPSLSWGAALDALYGALTERTKLRFV